MLLILGNACARAITIACAHWTMPPAMPLKTSSLLAEWYRCEKGKINFNHFLTPNIHLLSFLQSCVNKRKWLLPPYLAADLNEEVHGCSETKSPIRVLETKSRLEEGKYKGWGFPCIQDSHFHRKITSFSKSLRFSNVEVGGGILRLKIAQTHHDTASPSDWLSLLTYDSDMN